MLVGEDAQRLHRLVVVVQGLAHAHEDDVEAVIGEIQLADEDANLPDDFSGGEIPVDPHLAGQAERAAHRAADLRRDAEGHAVGVGEVLAGGIFGDADGLDVLAVAQREQELGGAVGRLLAAHDQRRVDVEVGGERRAQLAAQIAHEREVADAALVDPLKDLPGVETRLPEIVECLFQFGQFDAGDIGSRLCHHGAP